jgi:uracil-DNA glycosylase
MPSESNDRIRRLLVDRLESLQHAGVLQLPRKSASSTRSMRVVESRPAATEQSLSAAVTTSPEPPAQQPPSSPLQSNAHALDAMPDTRKKPASRPPASSGLFESTEPSNGEFAQVPSLEALHPLVAACTRCAELAQTRTQTVFGVGNSNARLWFLGEAPGADEDRLGEPFVGRGGQLLTKIIEACHLKREDVYIVNMLKCRPPGNRNPLPTELTNCRGYLDRQFDLIRPEFICCLGAVAAQNLLNTTVSIGKLRGRLHEYRGAKVVCTYHPAFLLRSPGFKKETWEDMKFLMREMGTPID